MKFPKFLLLSIVACGLIQQSLAERPKLIVTILVDQLRYDYLERFHDQFTDGGLRLLTDQGAFMTFAQYNYCPTVTGPGHASFLSGAPPAVHGIISNDWFDKRTLKILNCVGDSSVEGVGARGEGGKASPRNFIGSNFSDELRLRYRSKVVGISLKDRGAILPAGKKPLGAYWFDSPSGNFITSTYYRTELPEWVQKFNARQLPASFVGQTWKRLLDPKEYVWEDNAAGELSLAGEKTTTFDHTIAPSSSEGFETIVPTPFGNQLLAEFAVAAIEGEHLGEGPNPDLLCVSFSSIDACGHKFGPYSQEVQDVTLRLDRQLGEFLKLLDKKFGIANVAIVLTADHGVAPTAEFASEQGLDAQRNDSVALVGELLAKLTERFGETKFLLTPRIIDNNLYFNHDALRERHIAPEDVASFIREWALSSGKFQAAYTRWQLLDGRTPGVIGQRVFNGYNAERSGDIVLVPKAYTLPAAKGGTTHGTPYSYDTHIPVIFYGSEFRRGRYADEFYITDIAPTLCAALGVNEPSGCIGKPFVKALVNSGPADR